MRFVPALIVLLALAACESEPGSMSDRPVVSSLPQFITGLPGNGPDFGVAGLVPGPLPAGYDGFNNVGPQVAATHAAQVCTLGYEKLDEQSQPGDPIAFAEWHVRCNPYRPSF
jgi:hypothetical protein